MAQTQQRAQVALTEQNTIIEALRSQGVDLNSREAITAALQNGIAGQSRQDAFRILDDPQVQAAYSDVYNTVHQVRFQEQLEAALSPIQRAIIATLRANGVNLRSRSSIWQAIQNGMTLQDGTVYTREQVVAQLHTDEVRRLEQTLYYSLSELR